MGLVSYLKKGENRQSKRILKQTLKKRKITKSNLKIPKINKRNRFHKMKKDLQYYKKQFNDRTEHYETAIKNDERRDKWNEIVAGIIGELDGYDFILHRLSAKCKKAHEIAHEIRFAVKRWPVRNANEVVGSGEHTTDWHRARRPTVSDCVVDDRISRQAEDSYKPV